MDFNNTIKPCFSVVIPLYNKADTIARTLRSVQAQAYKNFEVIIVDDGSTDEGVLIAESFNGKLELKVVRQKNSGVSVARNTGAKHAKAPYLAFLDADDEWLPGYLEEINRLIEEFPNAEVYGTNYYCVTNKSLVCNRAWGRTRKLVDFATAWIKRCPIHTSSSVIWKTAFDAVAGFVPSHKYYEDAELLFKLAYRGRFCISQKPLVKYHTDANIRATNQSAPYGKYAHWLYLEELVASKCAPKMFYKVAQSEIGKNLVYNFVNDRLASSNQIKRDFPNMFRSVGYKGRLLLNRKSLFSWIYAILYKTLAMIQIRMYMCVKQVKN